MRRLPQWFPFLACAFGSVLIAPAQQPSTLPPSIDPAVWGCPNHPYVATVEKQGTPFDSEVQLGQGHPQPMEVYRDSVGHLCTDAFYDNGLPSVIMLRSSTEPSFIEIEVVAKAAHRLPAPFPDRSHASQTWTVSSLPARTILGIETVGLRYTRELPSQAGAGMTPVAVVEDDWFAPSMCLVLERHILNPPGHSQYERVVKLDQREPDAKLFQVPPEYVLHQSSGQ